MAEETQETPPDESKPQQESKDQKSDSKSDSKEDKTSQANAETSTEKVSDSNSSEDSKPATESSAESNEATEEKPAEAPASPKTKPKPKKEKKRSWLAETFVQVFNGLRSPDWPTKKMAFLFICFFTGSVITLSLTARQVYLAFKSPIPHPEEETLPAGEHTEGMKELSKELDQYATLEVGSFSVELKPIPGKTGPQGLIDIAEINIVIICDEPKTCKYIEDNLSRARDQMINVFIQVDRDRLLTTNGKLEIKRAILQRLNSWLPEGEVKNVVFTDIIVG